MPGKHRTRQKIFIKSELMERLKNQRDKWSLGMGVLGDWFSITEIGYQAVEQWLKDHGVEPEPNYFDLHPEEFPKLKSCDEFAFGNPDDPDDDDNNDI